jgi:hypothetical protein
MAKESDLVKAYFDNIRDNQIGGETDGITKDVAEDIGYTATPESFKQVTGKSSDLVVIDNSVHVLPERRPWTENNPTPEEKSVGKTALKTLRDQHPDLGKKHR